MESSTEYVSALKAFNIGDRVRILIQRNVFDKGTAPKWSSKIYKVGGFRGWSIVLEDDDAVDRVYRPRQLLKVSSAEVSLPERDEERAAEVREAKAVRRVAKEGIEMATPALVSEPRKLRPHKPVEVPVSPPEPARSGSGAPAATLTTGRVLRPRK
jgi:ribosomal protein L21E